MAMQDKLTFAPVLLSAFLGGWLLVAETRAGSVSKERDEAATNLLIAEAESDGLEVTLGVVTNDFSDLQTSYADTVTALSRTIERLEAAGVREASVAEITIEAARDTVTVAVIDTVAGPERLRSVMNDGVADISVDCQISTALCRWQYQLTITGRLLQVVGADGRPIAIAEIDQPNVNIDIPVLVWKLPDLQKRSLWDRVFTRGCIGVGALASGITWSQEKALAPVAISAAVGCALGHLAF